MITTREAALEAALQYCADAPVSGWTIAQAIAKRALSTPATEPQGYVEGLPIAGYIHGYPRNWGTCWEYLPPDRKDLSPLEWEPLVKLSDALAARPDPQPAAEPLTRVSLADLEGYGSTTQPAADTRVGDGPKGGVRFAVPAGDTKEQMRNWLTNTKEGQSLYNTGDCLLVWANEGDLFQPPATPAPSDKIAEAARKSLRDALAYIDKGHHGMARNILAAALAGQGETP